MKRISYIIVVVSFLAFAGCNLSDIEKSGDLCPPPMDGTNERVEGTLISIGDACTLQSCDDAELKKNLDIQKCPRKYPNCMRDEDNYSCVGDKQCPSGQFLCDDDNGTFFCVDPTARESCGAVQGVCDQKPYGGQDCSELGADGYCNAQNRMCQCVNDAFLCEEGCISPRDIKTCGAKTCGVANFGGENCEERGVLWECADSKDGWGCHCSTGFSPEGECVDTIALPHCPMSCGHVEDGKWECVTDKQSCGVDCQNCLELHPNGDCLKGECIIQACLPGEYPKYEGTQIKSCIKTSAQACAPYQMKVNGKIVNCDDLKTDEVLDVDCSLDGNCIVTQCKTGYHMDESGRICVENHPIECATDDLQNCLANKPPHASDMVCESSVCMIAACEANYHLSEDKQGCEPNMDKACALPDSNAPVDCGQNLPDHAVSRHCVAGQCLIQECGEGYHVSSERMACESNSDDACGGNQYADVVVACKSPLSACRNGGCACPNEKDIMNKENVCVPSECEGFFGVISATVRGGVCHAEECADGFTAKNGVCIPQKNCSAYGYKADSKTDLCGEPCGPNCDQSICKSYFKNYKGACIESSYCCGKPSDQACVNCIAKGNKACKVSTGECVD